MAAIGRTPTVCPACSGKWRRRRAPVSRRKRGGPGDVWADSFLVRRGLTERWIHPMTET